MFKLSARLLFFDVNSKRKPMGGHCPPGLLQPPTRLRHRNYRNDNRPAYRNSRPESRKTVSLFGLRRVLRAGKHVIQFRDAANVSVLCTPNKGAPRNSQIRISLDFLSLLDSTVHSHSLGVEPELAQMESARRRTQSEPWS